jgi:hypothetical protein
LSNFSTKRYVVAFPLHDSLLVTFAECQFLDQSSIFLTGLFTEGDYSSMLIVNYQKNFTKWLFGILRGIGKYIAEQSELSSKRTFLSMPIR